MRPIPFTQKKPFLWEAVGTFSEHETLPWVSSVTPANYDIPWDSLTEWGLFSYLAARLCLENCKWGYFCKQEKSHFHFNGVSIAYKRRNCHLVYFYLIFPLLPVTFYFSSASIFFLLWPRSNMLPVWQFVLTKASLWKMMFSAFKGSKSRLWLREMHTRWSKEPLFLPCFIASKK